MGWVFLEPRLPVPRAVVVVFVMIMSKNIYGVLVIIGFKLIMV